MPGVLLSCIDPLVCSNSGQVVYNSLFLRGGTSREARVFSLEQAHRHSMRHRNLLPRPSFGLAPNTALNLCFSGAKAMGVNAYGQPNGADNTRTEQKTTAYYIDEGVNGCFKDRVLCGVNFEPCPVSLAGGRRHRKPIAAAAAVSGAVESQQDGGWKKDEGNTAAASATAASRERAENDEGGEEAGEGQGEGQGEGDGEGENGEEDAVVMGPSGLPADVVARKRLPKSLKPGDWLFFSQMGAYTASIATVTSSSVLEASYCYVASTPDVGATAASGGCIGSGSLRMGESGARDGCLHGKQ